jgi:S1-C subfamily serine protease
MMRLLVAMFGLSACTPGPTDAGEPQPVETRLIPVEAPGVAAPSAGLPSLREVARRASRYTVFIKSGGAYGAGVVLDRAGRVLTCNHVLMGNSAEVQFEGAAKPTFATIVARAAELDLALLQLNEPLDLEPAALGAITNMERGDEVFSMGAPRKMRFSFHRGIVSFVGRRFDRDEVVYLQTDLAMSPGSSGGPVLDRHGKLVGIATFILRNSEGLAFAVPVDYALRRFADIDATRDASTRRAQRDAFEGWLRTHAEDNGGTVDSILTTDGPP